MRKKKDNLQIHYPRKKHPVKRKMVEGTGECLEDLMVDYSYPTDSKIEHYVNITDEYIECRQVTRDWYVDSYVHVRETIESSEYYKGSEIEKRLHTKGRV